MLRSAAAAATTTAARGAVRTARSHSTHASKPSARIPLQQHQPSKTVALAKQSQSTLALECVGGGGGGSAGGRRVVRASDASRLTTTTTTPLTRDQVRSVVLSAAIPMIGFGFMDNFIMITAGSVIDNTLGVQMGLATMTAAALGQVVSDVSGVVFGDTLARSFKVEPARLSGAQKKLASVARLRLGGAVGGVILGCCLGATALRLIPDDREEAAPVAARPVPTNADLRDRLQRLQTVVHDVMTSAEEPWDDKLAACTLYVKNVPPGCLPSAPAAAPRAIPFFGSPAAPRASVARLDETTDDPEVLHALEEGRVVVFADAIYVPMRGDDATPKVSNVDDVVGIVKIKLEHGSFYTGSEIKDAKRVARNLGFFLNRMVRD
eukprot:CAMPEP_0197175702 /NCGR_PEP_ID=MMETSP1423-20130617/1850_1 /TAXON_ID=476441 /ORGANISM="Pseudo-nitzschia heimii, Strain UNC1101" /LENGTH=378 /DNA_ID=CAMNT_0042624923 /DNA_START=164 /DNA_END=1300 /DNA_ORIENTATION=-